MIAAHSLAEEYANQLAVHLAGSSEAVLLHAYELGRSAAVRGVGVLELVNVHHHALRAVVAGERTSASGEYLDRAAEFLGETLSPLEMMLRGFRESNSQLIASNEQLRRAKLEAEAANRELDAFSYSVAHDLRAPLRSLDGFSAALLEDYASNLDEEGRQYLAYIRGAAGQMARLIDDLLELSRVTRSDLKREPVDLTEMARAIAARLQSTSPERQAEFIIADGLAANADRGLSTIVLENLIGNAWKYSGKRPQARIEVGITTREGRDAYYVRDNGAGFDMAFARKLFGVFQRLHSAREFEGTGIGLATVQRIVRRHGGSIWADGQVDHGATFYFTLS